MWRFFSFSGKTFRLFRIEQMSGREIEQADPAKDAPVVSTTDPAVAKLVDEGQTKPKVAPKKKKSVMQALINFIYNPQRKTVLGRSSLNWGM